jgi:hypothetical protein
VIWHSHNREQRSSDGIRGLAGSVLVRHACFEEVESSGHEQAVIRATLQVFDRAIRGLAGSLVRHACFEEVESSQVMSKLLFGPTLQVFDSCKKWSI